ncbi:unnamed protein product [Owenia fusiformis]|uniref:Uncharacterized protein n=1 Tax=Owenia fusiformis TaxID=6347 RepID=A0A8J1XJ08_OWEFU|nr:unnamed protein product [Owenia fusiformis]
METRTLSTALCGVVFCIASILASPASENGNCFKALGMRTREIPVEWISASSTASGLTLDNMRFRVFPGKPWCPASGKNRDAFVQVSFPQPVRITGVYVDGFANRDSISSFTIRVNDLNTVNGRWRTLSNNGIPSVYPPFITATFPGITTDAIQIVPKTYRGRPCMKLEVYGCASKTWVTPTMRPTTTTRRPTTTTRKPTTTTRKPTTTTRKPTTTTRKPTTTTRKPSTTTRPTTTTKRTTTTRKPTTTTTLKPTTTVKLPSRCTAFPELRIPKIDGDVSGETTYLTCTLDLTDQRNVQLLVTWYHNGMEVRRQWLDNNVNRGRLDVSGDFKRWKTGDKFTCSTSGRFVERTCTGPTSQATTSLPLVAEIKVTNPGNIVIEEGGDSKDITIEITAPPLFFCKSAYEIEKCTLQFDVSVEKVRQEWKCRKRTVISQAVIGWNGRPEDAFCGVVVTETTYQRLIRIPIRAKIDFKYDRNQQRVVWIEAAHKVAGNVVRVEKIKQISVAIIDRDRKSQCRSVNDPHLTSFDGKRFDNMLVGEFYIYRHKSLPFQIHGFYTKCGRRGRASCNCGVGIKSGDDVIMLSRCPRPKPPKKPGGVFDWIFEYEKLKLKGKLGYKILGKKGLTWALITGSSKKKPPLELKMFKNGELTSGTKIFSFNKGNKYEVHLPTGLYLTVTVSGKTHVNIYVNPSPIDFKQSEGLCGFYDGNQRNDLMMPDGSIHRPPRKQARRPDVFNNAWRVPRSDSIFNGCRRGANYRPKHSTYCNCIRAAKGECGQRFDVETCDIAHGGTDITKLLEQNSVIPQFRQQPKRGKRQATVDDLQPIGMPFEFDKDYKPAIATWPTPSGNWTETKAKTFCEDYIMKTKATENCEKGLSSKYTEEVNTCMLDIQVSDGTDWADSSLESVKEQCQSEITKFDLTPDAPKASTMPGSDKVTVADIEKNLCLNDCNGKERGTCVEGTCQCLGSYGGSDCSLSKKDVPTVTGIPQDGLCNQRASNCNSVVIQGDNFVDSKDLKCFLEEVEIDIDNVYATGRKNYPEATFISQEQVVCPLPTDTRSYLVNVANDGKTWSSNRVLHIAFDPLCFGCMIDPGQGTAVCMRRNDNTTCIIEERCYGDNETNADDSCLRCDPGLSDKWTKSQSKECIGKKLSQNNTVGIVVGTVVPVVVIIIIVVIILVCCCKKNKSKTANAQSDVQLSSKVAHNNNAYQTGPGEKSDMQPTAPPVVSRDIAGRHHYYPPSKQSTELEPTYLELSTKK